MAHGVWLRPFGRLIYAMPPYACSSDEIRQITNAMTVAAGAL
jgi:adenosylmethionine-8-amino-7-oxononanoate aminotransferase